MIGDTERDSLAWFAAFRERGRNCSARHRAQRRRNSGSPFRRQQSPRWCDTRRYRALRVAP
jgi:hypothetical protein